MYTCKRVISRQAVIEKSGTGVERSGTGAERIGAGGTYRWTLIGLALMFMLVPHMAFAGDVQVLCKPVNGSGIGAPCAEMSSVGFEIEVNIDGIVVSGVGAVSNGGYALIALQERENSGDFSLLVNGSGIGSASTGPSQVSDLAWGFAEVAVDGEEVFIIVHRIEPDGTLVEVATN